MSATPSLARAQSSAAAPGRIVGSVIGVDGLPIVGAQIIVEALRRQVVTDDSGRFEMAGLTAQSHVVHVRRLGYVDQIATIMVSSGERVEQTFTLRRITQLDTVSVRETAVLRSFEEHRRNGTGHFITRDQLERQRNRKFHDIIADVPGVRIRTGVNGRAWVYSSRRPITSINPRATSRFHLDEEDIRGGAPQGLCYAQVYLDDVLMYGGREGEALFDVNTLIPDHIEAVEYYAGPSRTPMRYSRLNSACGVLVIHSRRSPS